MHGLESILGSLSVFEPLRPDEIARVVRRFEVVELAAGETRRFEARMIVILHGAARLDGTAVGPGDRWGDLELLAGTSRAADVTARRACAVATLDRAGLDAILAEFPVVALPLASEIASELHATIDTARELAELHAEQLPRAQLAASLEARRRSHTKRTTRVRRFSVRGVFRRLVVQRGAEPPFWMLVGFLVAVFLARVVVALILKFNLQQQLFALVPGNDPNPKHIHHFNYGLILIGLSGLAALYPIGRRVLRVLSFVFGFGCGLVLDEFALFWNLNPSYEDAHLTVAAFAAGILVQLVYFRRFWAALARRTIDRLRGTR